MGLRNIIGQWLNGVRLWAGDNLALSDMYSFPISYIAYRTMITGHSFSMASWNVSNKSFCYVTNAIGDTSNKSAYHCVGFDCSSQSIMRMKNNDFNLISIGQ